LLGEKVGEESGRVVGMRVLSADPAGPKVEVSVQQTGKLLGKETTTSITYWSTPKAGGLLHGEGQGIIMTPDGDMVTFSGTGVGRPTGRGMAASFRGAIFYQTASKDLSRLNEIAGVFEFEVDESGNTYGKVWEWK
jgi:hypothetical protein